MEIVALVVLPLFALPVMLEFLHHRLGVARPWARAWWVVAAVALASWLVPVGIWSGLTAGLFLIPALFLAAAGITRFAAALRQPAEPGTRASWVMGQAVISLGLLGPAFLGWALLARTLGIQVGQSVVARAVVGAALVGLLVGELAITSGARWGRVAAGLAVATAILALVPGPVWLIGAGLALITAGLCLRLEIRPVLPGAPGLDGLAAIAAGAVAVATALWWPVVAVVAAVVGLTLTALLWSRVVGRLNEPTDHAGGCSCCADHAAPVEQDSVQPG